MARQKVLVTTTTFPRWTGDTVPPFIYELEKRLVNEFDIIIIAPHFSGARKSEKVNGMTIRRFQYFWPVWLQRLCYGAGILPNIKINKWLIFQIPFLVLTEFFAIKKIIKNEKIDFIHAHWILPQGLIAAVINMLYRIPFILTVHGDDIARINSKWKKPLLKFTLRKCKFCTVNSEATKNQVLKVFNLRNIKIIPMGVDLEVFNSGKKDDNIRIKYNIEGNFLLFVGRLVQKKGVEYLIKAMPHIIKKHLTTKLLIVGEGILRENLENLARGLGLQDSVIFTGSLSHSELPKYFATADIFIGPSTSEGLEGLGVVFIEALASGTCVIGSDVGGVSGVIINNKTGLLVKEGQPEEIARAVIKLLDNYDLREVLAREGQEYIKQKFDWEILVRQFKSLYNEL